jgi:hypothetical protein
VRACRWFWDLLLLSFSFLTNRIPFSFFFGEKKHRDDVVKTSPPSNRVDKVVVRSFVRRHVLRPSQNWSLWCRGVDVVFSIREWIRLGRRV